MEKEVGSSSFAARGSCALFVWSLPLTKGELDAFLCHLDTKGSMPSSAGVKPFYQRGLI
jgi:hypothetical protein